MAITITGITPKDFINKYAGVEFDFSKLCENFSGHCKDFNDPISMTVLSKAMEFSSKVLFELGPRIWNTKSKANTAVRFRFQYPKEDTSTGEKALSSHSVFITFSERLYNIKDSNVMVITFQQATLLAIEVFIKVMEVKYSHDASILMTPLCAAVYSKESIAPMAIELGMRDIDVIKMINSSTVSGGEHLAHSDFACAIVSMIAMTKNVANKNIRNQMINKLIKQYRAMHKQYVSTNFDIISKYVIGGVPELPQGMDAENVIENFSNIQIKKVNLRAIVLAQRQSEHKVQISGLGNTEERGVLKMDIASAAETFTT